MSQQNPLGMFDVAASSLPDPANEDAMRQRALAFAQLNPDQRVAFQQNLNAQNIGNAAGMLTRGAVQATTGQDMRTTGQRAAGVQASLKAALQGVDLSNPDIAYPAMIGALQKEGLNGQAMALTKEYESIKNTRSGRKLQEDQLARLTKKDEQEAAFKKLKLEEPTSPAGKAMRDIEAMTARVNALVDGPAKDAAQANLDKLVADFGKNHGAGAGMKVVALGDRVELWQDGSLISTRTVNQSPNSVAAQETAAANRAQMNEATTDTLAKATQAVRELTTIQSDFKKAYVPPTGLVVKAASALGYSDFIQRAKAIGASNTAERDAALWWSSLTQQVATLRHALYGGNLTDNERAAYEQVKPIIGQSPEVVQQRVALLVGTLQRELDTRVNAQQGQGRTTTGLGTSGGAPAPAPTRPAAQAAGGFTLPSEADIDAAIARRQAQGR